MRPTVRIKVQPRARVKVGTIVKFPAQVIAGDGINIDQSGGVFTFSLDSDVAPNFDAGTPYTLGDLLVAADTNSVGALHDVATGNVLLSGGLALPPSYGKVTSAHVNSATGSGAFVFGTAPTITGPTITGGTIDNTPIGGTTRAAGAFSALGVGAAAPASTTQPVQITTATAAAQIGQTNSGSTWVFGPTTAISTAGWGLFSSTAAAFRIRFNDAGLMTLGHATAGAAGGLNFENATSGNITISPPTGALGSNTLTLPAAGTDTFAVLALAQTFTNKTLTSPVISGGTINNATIGGTTRAAGSFSGVGIGASWSASTTQPLEITTATAAAFIAQTNSGSAWLIGPTTGISSAGWGLFSSTAGAYRISIDNSGVISFPAYGTGVLKTASGVISTGAGITDLAATTANRLFGTNGSGVSGLVTLPAAGLTLSAGAIALANDLSALEGLSSTGFAARTTTDTWAQRTITGTANEITVTNGDGVSGNPTLSLPAALTFTGKTVTGGTFSGVTLSGTIPGTPTFSGANFITLGNLATQSAYTLVLNNTGGAASPTAIDVSGFTIKGSPAGTDYVLISDGAAGGIWKRATVATVGAAGAVSSFNGRTGAVVPVNGDYNTPAERASFSANKNAVNQSGFAVNAFTKVTFTTEEFDLGSYYDNTNSKWTPQSGKVTVKASLYISDAVIGDFVLIAIYKNGSQFKATGQCCGSPGNGYALIDCTLDANGTDYYEIYVYVAGASGTRTVNGSTSNSYFQGAKE
jgi:hypothetical protein